MSEVKLCECGCGGETSIAAKTDARRGVKKGERMRYISGHYKRNEDRSSDLQALEDQVRPYPIEITADIIEELRERDDTETAEILDWRARAIERHARRSFIELGLICQEMRDRMLWRFLTDPETQVVFHSWEAWVKSCLQVSTSLAYSSVNVLESLAMVPVEDLMQMPQVNVKHLAKLTNKAKTDPEVIASAKHDTEREFIDKIAERHPEQHLVYNPRVILKFGEGDRGHFEDAISIALWAYNVERREDAVANIVAFFLDGNCEREGCNGMTNREAFESRNTLEGSFHKEVA